MCNYQFREIIPKRRTDIEHKARYQEYKQQLREDFNSRCGYCNDHESWRNSYYEIDHFIPKIYLNEDKHSSYDNLVFSCRYCNNAKRHKWPTQDRNSPNNGTEGFVDPCSEEYDSLFKRNALGEIIPQNELGIWMYKELKLFLARHSLLWQIERIERILKEFRRKGLHNNEDTKELFIKMSCYFQDFIEQLREENAR